MNLHHRLRMMLADAQDPNFDEKKHPRRKDGEFAPKGKGDSSPAPSSTSVPSSDEDEDDTPLRPTKSGHLQLAHPDREQWPEHIKALKLPPAWHDVAVSHDPNADLLAIGRDAKNRAQYVYSEKFAKSQSALKFARITELDSKFHYIKDQNDAARRSRDPKLKDHGDCMHLIMTMGLRPGGDDDTGAEKKAYGASTLEGQHVALLNGVVRLR